jgi:Fe-S-cluster containining protein
MAAEPWYRDGLRFACTRCGNCCGGAPGTVRVSDAEIEALARRTGLEPEPFRIVYTRRLRGGAVSLRERGDGTCILYDAGRGCSVYSDRPRQCRTWPFWRSVVHSPERWAEEALGCPGIGRGPLHSAARIECALEDDGTARQHDGADAQRGGVPRSAGSG